MIPKKEWIEYNRKANSIELNVKDHDEQTLDFFKLYKNKTRDTKRVLNKLKKKYGFDLNQEEIKKEKSKNNNWLEKDVDW